jgi:hypothetical protein
LVAPCEGEAVEVPGALVVPFATAFVLTLPLMPFSNVLLVPMTVWVRLRGRGLLGMFVRSVGVVPGAGLIGGVVTTGAGAIVVLRF